MTAYTFDEEIRSGEDMVVATQQRGIDACDMAYC